MIKNSDAVSNNLNEASAHQSANTYF